MLPRLLSLLPLILSSTAFCQGRWEGQGVYIHTGTQLALAVEPNLQWEDNARRLLPEIQTRRGAL
jgi:hypothetical protein